MAGPCSSTRCTARGWSLKEIQLAFAIFIATETWLTPLGGWAVDRLGPRKGPPIMIALGGALVAISWVINAYADVADACFISARRFPAPARARSTRPASATP